MALPTEVMVEILGKLDKCTLYTMCRVSKPFHSILTTHREFHEMWKEVLRGKLCGHFCNRMVGGKCTHTTHCTKLGKNYLVRNTDEYDHHPYRLLQQTRVHLSMASVRRLKYASQKRRAKLIQKLEHEEQQLAEIITRESALEAKKTKCILSLSLKVRGEKRKRVV
jgi:hypothetical protein